MKHEPGMAYNSKTLNKVFAFLSVIFLLVAVWMMFEDYIRPWKAVQIEGIQVKRKVIAREIAEEQKKINQEKLNVLGKQLEDAKNLVAQRKDAIAKIQKELDVLSPIKYQTKIDNGVLGSKSAALAFSYGEALHHDDPIKAKKIKKELSKVNAKWAIIKDKFKAQQFKEKELNAAIAKEKEDETKVKKEIQKIVGKIERMKAAKKKTSFKDPVAVVRNLPFIDFLDPTLKIEQLVLNNLADDRFFQKVPKVDRCITCHMFIDKPGYEDQPQPYTTHSNLELMVAGNSHHPMKQFGCTSCHGGEGHRIRDFSAPVHTPETEEQKAMWVEKYHWKAPHKVPMPMYKLSQTESQCIKCHQNVERIPGAEKLNEGLAKIEEYGCYACHVIPNFAHKPKPGPSLKKIKGKLTKEFAKSWVWDPKSFNKHARMPSYFNQDNNSKKEFQVKNIAEVNAMVEYLWEISDGYKPYKKYTGGNIEKGKELIASVGCISCHGVEGLSDDVNVGAGYKGPYLSGTGSKVEGDWLVSWLKKPSHYQEDTIMPSFRLSDREANHIAAYLLSLKNESFEKKKFTAMNAQARDEILTTYLSTFDTVAGAKANLAKMDDHARTMELGKRSLGKYGCYSCHNITGFEDRARIGPDLTEEGSKPIAQFGFNLQHDVPHERDAWIEAHLINPRRWDEGMNKPFKDLARMPNFYLTKKEAKSMTTAILGYTSEYIPPLGKKNYDEYERIKNEGEKVIYKYNCVGCHNIDGMGGDILAAYEDKNDGPPYLTDQGHRVQSDWLYNFLENVHTIRPWLKVRMPSFKLTVEERNKLVAYFQAGSRQHTFTDFTGVQKWEPGERAAAKKLFAELACTSCHTIGFNNEEASAPNLHDVKKRLRPSWVKKWLENPLAYLPHTVMPAFWEDGESQAPDILGGDADKQMDALVKYLYEIGEDKYPAPLRKD